jgi:hypothetical protein
MTAWRSMRWSGSRIKGQVGGRAKRMHYCR